MTSYWRSLILWLATCSNLYGSGCDAHKTDDAPSTSKTPGTDRGEKRHSRSSSSSSSFAPIVVIPGAVNSSFMLLSPTLSHNATTTMRVRVHPYSEKANAGASSPLIPLRTIKSKSTRDDCGHSTLTRRSPFVRSDADHSVYAVKVG